MSAKSERRVVEWELLPSIPDAERANADLEIDAVYEQMPAPASYKQVVIVVDPKKIATGISVAAVPVGGVAIIVLYFETILLTLKWIVLSIAGVGGFVLTVVAIGSILKSMSTTRRRSTSATRHPGWSTGTRQRGNTTVNQRANTIINHFY